MGRRRARKIGQPVGPHSVNCRALWWDMIQEQAQIGLYSMFVEYGHVGEVAAGSVAVINSGGDKWRD